LVVKMNLAASQMDENGVPSADNAGSDGQLITHLLMANPTQPVYDEDGNYKAFNLTQNFNPMYLLHIYEDETNTTRVVGNVEASLRVFKGLTYKINYALDNSVSERNTTIYKNFTVMNSDGKYSENHLKNTSQLLEHYLTYHLYKNKHKLIFLGGFSYQKFYNEATGFIIEGINEKGEGVAPKYNPDYTSYTSSELSGSAQENELQSYFGRANYDYNSKYMLTASLRADGSTRFGENKKYGYFPSFAMGWNISQESFMQNATFVDNMKIRASWGQTGNQEVQNKITKASYSVSSSSGYHIDDGSVTNGLSIKRTANPDLHWEVVTQYDFGLDFTLFNNLVYGSVDYYNKTTTDAILYITAPLLSPTEDRWENVDASIINKGFEFFIGGNIINTKDLKWSVDFNATTLDNVVEDLPVSELYSGSISGPGQSDVHANIYKSGYEVGSFYLLNHIGFDENGEEIFEDINGDGNIDSDDRIIVEGGLPNFTYGINSYVTYRNFDLSFSIIGQKGGYLFNNTNFTAANINNLQSDRNVLKDYYNSGANSGNSPQISTYYLEESDFIRLNTVRLGYTFNTSNINWLNGVNVYLSGQNLLTITDYSGFDPLANADKSSGGNQSVGIDYTSYPSARTYMFGLALKF
jgi:iron complex outermembrane receptor protein